MKKQLDKRQILGWIAVGLSTTITCVWAFWGIIENFHEGWYYESWLSNVGMMFIKYLSPMLIFMGVTLISIYWPRVGGSLHAIFALLAVWFFQAFSNAATFLLILPLIGFGALYWFGRPQPRKLAVSLVVGLPMLTLILSGIEPVLRVSQRIDDGNLQTRLVRGNGVNLTWAPDGPGWPRSGTDWHSAAYKTTPDKESPLWNIHSQVIYWWTATEVDDERAYIIVYDGKVWLRSKQFGPAYLGFRCVK